MKICVISDSHDNRQLMASAVAAAKEQGAEAVIHCGDVVAPTTLKSLQKFGLPVHVIYGNNTGDLFAMSKLATETDSMIRFYGQDAGINLKGRNIFIVHYPHYARALATTGDWDIVCCGHDHKASIQSVQNIKNGHTWYINPGTVGGVGAPATYVLGDLETMEFAIYDVPLPDAA
jgi:hypothetical protein